VITDFIWHLCSAFQSRDLLKVRHIFSFQTACLQIHSLVFSNEIQIGLHFPIPFLSCPNSLPLYVPIPFLSCPNSLPFMSQIPNSFPFMSQFPSSLCPNSLPFMSQFPSSLCPNSLPFMSQFPSFYVPNSQFLSFHVPIPFLLCPNPLPFMSQIPNSLSFMPQFPTFSFLWERNISQLIVTQWRGPKLKFSFQSR